MGGSKGGKVPFPPLRLRAATRGSRLARWQTDHVAHLLAAAHPGVGVEPVVVQTTGDRVADRPLWQMGGQGAFVREVQAAVLDGRADLAVHSAKDLPPRPTQGLALVAVPPRGDPRDALVGRPLDDLPPGAVVATGSPRRRAQLAGLRPDLTFAELRGSIDTRLRKASGVDAIVVAAVALARLGQEGRAAQVLEPGLMLPQVAQGALAVECGEGDGPTRALLSALDHAPSRAAVEAERAYLARLGSGCELPVAAHARTTDDGAVRLEAMIATLDGRIVLRHVAAGIDPGEVGRAAARYLLVDAGAEELLAGVGVGAGLGARAGPAA